MKHASFLVLSGVLIASNAAHAQVVTTPVEPAPAAQAPTAPAPGASAPAAKPESRRDEVRAMEVFLIQALQKGAQDLARQMKVNEPNSSFVTGPGRARGFVLEGYGMFFDVDVPGMRQSVVWSAQMLQLEQDRQDMLRFLAAASPNDERRKIAEMRLRQIERWMGVQGGTILLTNPTPAPTTNAEMVAPPGLVVGATVPVVDGPAPQPPATASMSRALAPSMVQPVQQPRDPNELYTDSVKNALIETMLRYNGFLNIRDNEWLTVAASDSDGPQVPGQVEELSTIIISIRGADLAAFRAGKLTREEVWKKVQVREF